MPRVMPRVSRTRPRAVLTTSRKRGIGVAAIWVDSIVKAFSTFDESWSPPGTLGKTANDLRIGLRVEIEVRTSGFGGCTQPPGIDVIRPFFEGIDFDTASFSSSGNTDSDDRLAARFV